ncbi:MAG: oligoendopeptidase F, partial [Natronomonas sp.]
MSSVPERSEIDDDYKWDLGSMFADDEAWEEAYAAVEERLDELRAYEGQVTDDPETLRAALELRESIQREVSNVAAYARMRRDEDTTNDTYQALLARAQSLAADARSAGSFLEPELQAADRERIEGFLEDDPELSTYEHYVEDVFRTAAHTRSAEIEELLADLSEVTGAAGEVYNMLSNADMEFPAVEVDGEERRITLSNFTTLQKHTDRDVRRRVYEAFYDEWGNYRNSVA